MQVAQWWNGLDDTARTALVAEHPERIGALDGLPAAARDLANRALLDDERRRLESVATQLRAELDAMFLGGTVIDRLGVTGLFTDADAGLEQTVRKIEALDAIDATLAHGDRQLLALDLSGREAMAAVAVGDVDTADHLAVFVPGAGSTVQGNLQATTRRSRRCAILLGSTSPATPLASTSPTTPAAIPPSRRSPG